MPRKRVYTVTQVVRNPRLFQTALPFDITSNGQLVCTVMTPSGQWYECENCGENTKNLIEFQDKNFEWQRIILCDKCSAELL